MGDAEPCFPSVERSFFSGRLSCFSLGSRVTGSGQGVPGPHAAKKNTASSWPLNARVVSKLAGIRCPALLVRARAGTKRKACSPTEQMV